MPDVFAAVRDYVATWALPVLDGTRIFRGWRHNTVLLEDGEDFAVITVLADNRRGTNLSDFASDPTTRDDGVVTRSKLVICDIQVEFYGDAERSRQRACVLETLVRDEIAVQFFEKHDITPLYADQTREITPDEDMPHVRARYATTLHVSYWLHLSAQVSWFDNVNVHVLTEVDTHYPTED